MCYTYTQGSWFNMWRFYSQLLTSSQAIKTSPTPFSSLKQSRMRHYRTSHPLKCWWVKLAVPFAAEMKVHFNSLYSSGTRATVGGIPVERRCGAVRRVVLWMDQERQGGCRKQTLERLHTGVLRESHHKHSEAQYSHICPYAGSVQHGHIAQISYLYTVLANEIWTKTQHKHWLSLIYI